MQAAKKVKRGMAMPIRAFQYQTDNGSDDPDAKHIDS